MMRRVTGVLVTILLGLMVAGCGTEKMDAFIRTDVTTAIDSRVVANISIVERLKAAGLLTSAEADKLKESLRNSAAAYSGEKLASNSKLREDLFNAVVDWRAPVFRPGSDGKMDGMTEKEWYDAHITSYVAKYGTSHARNNLPLFKGTGSQIKPIVLIDPQTGVDLNSKFGFEVHVLKPMAEIEAAGNMDGVMQLLKEALDSGNSNIEGHLTRIFEPARDSSGNTVKLLDTTDDKYKIVKSSRGSSKVDSNNKVRGNYSVNSSANLTLSSGYTAKPGVDMVIKTNATNRDLMALRFMEFDSDAVDRVIAAIGMNPDQYLFVGNKVYILEYPVYAVDSIKMENNRFSSSFIKSNIAFNIKTGRLTRADSGVYMENSDPYLIPNGASSNNQESKSSFTIIGEAEGGMEFVRDNGVVKVRTARVVLRDYLEATYAPGVVNNEKMVVLGRKLRIKNFSGSTSTLFAEFYDKNGVKLENTAGIYIKDIADFEGLRGSNSVVKRLPRSGEVLGREESGGVVSNNSLGKIEELPREIVKSIKPVEVFPGNKLGAVDRGESSKPLFYAMAVSASAFDTGLFSGWINNGDLERNSLGWWQNWLANPDRSYIYRINSAALENFLVENYTFDLQQSGIVILDLKVIASIQNQMNFNNRNATIARFRTTFVIIGWGLIIYGMLLMVAWIFDTNVDLGFNLLEKLSFKQMVATKDDSIVGGKYVGIGNVITKAMVLLVVGVLLINLNVIDLILAIVRMFGGIADVIGNLLGGI